jgi:hygromycin-B 7''-O-kinase
MADRTSNLPIINNLGSWNRIFTDRRLWQPVVLDICRRTGLAEGQRIDSTFPGTCAVFVVDKTVVIKVFPPFLTDDYRRAVEVYRLIGDSLDPYTAKLLAHGTYRDQVDWSYQILSFMPGQAIREVRHRIRPFTQQAIAHDLGWIISTLHELPLTEPTMFDLRPEAWHAFIQERLEQCLVELDDILPAHMVAEAGQFLGQTWLLEQPAGFQPRLLNGDLTEDHLLLIEQLGEWRISAVIDWADALVGAVEYEWVALWFGLCAQDSVFFRAILRSYDPTIRLDFQFRQRMLAHTFIHRFGPQIIDFVLKQPGAPTINSLVELQAWLWPPMLD